MKRNIFIELRENELIVLSELLYRINDSDILKDFFNDQSEQRVLWDLEAILEKKTPNILGGDYSITLKKAREEVRDLS